MKKREKNKNLEKLKEILENPRKRAILFFVFYFFFFLILIVMIRSTPQKEPMPKENQEESEKGETNLSKINYQYIYTIKEDEKITTYTGKAYRTKEMFTEIKNGQVSSYYKVGDHYFKKQNKEYLPVENPYSYQVFLSLKNLENLLEKQQLNNVEGQKNIYQVAVVDLLEMYDKEFVYDGFAVANLDDDKIEVTKENGRITKIECFLDNMITYYTLGKENKLNTLTITLEFLDFGEITDFDIEEE